MSTLTNVNGNNDNQNSDISSHSSTPAKLNFYLIGNNISHSLSPTIHNTGFDHHNLPHQYFIFEVPTVDDRVRDLLLDRSFGGASVTFPHKLHVQQYLDTLSDEARLMGAVNTIIATQPSLATPSRTLHGENTDWIGIRNCLLLGNPSGKFDYAVVVGAGGAARAAVFAFQALGMRKLMLVNRTKKRAEEMMDDFERAGRGIEFEIYDSLTHLPQRYIGAGTGAIVSCIPADHIVVDDIPAHMFRNGSTGALVEMAYREHDTALMRTAESQGRGSWRVFGGVQVLMEQGFAQFEMWTGVKAPVAVMRKAVEDKIRQQKAM